MDIFKKSAIELRDAILRKEISCVEVIEKVWERIDKIEPQIKAFTSLDKVWALSQARSLQKKLDSSERTGALFGIPVAVKDNICTKEFKTTCSSKILSNFAPPYDAFVVQKIKEEDGIIIGKTNLDEFAMGSSTENSAFFVSKNPWNLEYVSGGSSGGSAAAVVSGSALLAFGSDTGGSIRQPASLCGAVGLKPTYGLVSRFGLVAYASSLDQIGPITKCVPDCALMLSVIAKHDPVDSTSISIGEKNYLSELSESKDFIKSVKLGIPDEYIAEGINSEVRRLVLDAVEVYKKLGASIERVSLPNTEYGIPVYYIIATAEASSNLARYDGVKYGYRADSFEDMIDMYEKSRSEGFGAEVKRRIMLGTFALSAGYYDAYYLKALKVRRLIKEDFDNAFKKVDAIICPTSPVLPFKIGEKINDPLAMYLCDILTICLNLAGLPGISIPCGLSKDGLPVGVQIIGRPFDEETVLKIANAYEQETRFYEMLPVEPKNI